MQIQRLRFIFLVLPLVVPAKNGLSQPVSANQDGNLGLYQSADFQLVDGNCSDCKTIPQALWYFKNELLAVPATQASDFSADAQSQTDIANWLADDPDLTAKPPLIWLGSDRVIAESRLSGNGRLLTDIDGNSRDFQIEAKIPTNRSYWNDQTLHFFSQRSIRLRGAMMENKFMARTVWPRDYKIPPDSMLNPPGPDETLKTLVQFENGGAQSAYQARLLWERGAGAARQSSGKAVMGIMLNGAQGDDDEAHGGHFAIVTGRFEPDGDYSRWLVNNFYNLDSFSEKGIIAAVTPMDKYLMDLNSGQSYYRPSYMVVAAFKVDYPAALYQAAINRVFNHFYRHDLEYDHSSNNCSGVSIDAYRTIGWHIPLQGVDGYVKAIAAYAYVSASEKSLEKGRKIYDYLTTEATRLYPAVAFDAMGNDLLMLAQGRTERILSELEQSMTQNIEAIWFVRIPQIPSSRAFGQAAVYSFDEFMTQAPSDRSQWKIIPVEPRPFPNTMRDGLALQQTQSFPVPVPVGETVLGIILVLVAVGRKVKKRA